MLDIVLSRLYLNYHYFRWVETDWAIVPSCNLTTSVWVSLRRRTFAFGWVGSSFCEGTRISYSLAFKPARWLLLSQLLPCWLMSLLLRSWRWSFGQPCVLCPVWLWWHVLLSPSYLWRCTRRTLGVRRRTLRCIVHLVHVKNDPGMYAGQKINETHLYNQNRGRGIMPC